MKTKLRLLVLFIAMVTVFTGCKAFPIDKKHATVEISTTSGYSEKLYSYNGLGTGYNGSRIAKNHETVVEVKDQNDICTLHMKCKACGYEEFAELHAPAEQIFMCDCPDKGDEANNAREYFAICVKTAKR